MWPPYLSFSKLMLLQESYSLCFALKFLLRFSLLPASQYIALCAPHPILNDLFPPYLPFGIQQIEKDPIAKRFLIRSVYIPHDIYPTEERGLSNEILMLRSFLVSAIRRVTKLRLK